MLVLATVPSLMAAMSTVSDPRHRRGVRHPFTTAACDDAQSNPGEVLSRRVSSGLFAVGTVGCLPARGVGSLGGWQNVEAGI